MVVKALCVGRLQATSLLHQLVVHYWRVGVAFSFSIFFIATSSRILQKHVSDDKMDITFQPFETYLGERLTHISNITATLHISNGQKMLRQVVVSPIRKPASSRLIYIHIPPPAFKVIFGDLKAAREEKNQSSQENDPITEYFEMIQRPTSFCRKLARMGGELKCSSNGVTTPFMDGHKLVCLDPEFQIGGSLTNTNDCLALSFGIELDISYDLSIRNANCEVHMFDTLNFGPFFENKIKYFYFHKFGLGSERKVLRYPNNETSEVDTLQNIILRFGLSRRLVNHLKIDIEGAEWEAFEEILTRSFLDTVGQIALEVHAFNTTLRDIAKQATEFRRFRKILQDLQEHGFRRVSYWDTVNERWRIKNGEGKVFESAGELLLVNSNWYRPDFRLNGKQKGFNFLLLNSTSSFGSVV